MFTRQAKMKKSRVIYDDAQAVNFREIRMGNIAPGTLFRSSHPIKDYKQEAAISMLAGKAGIAAVLNLCDTSSRLSLKAFLAPWYNALFINGRIIGLGMDFSITSDRFKTRLKDALEFIIKTDGPWLIHCHAGVDRTGFVCMVLEAFMGAKLDDVIDDYLLSFNSLLGSSIYADLHTAMQILSVMSDSIAINEQNLQQVAEMYLQKKIGLSAVEIELLKNKLTATLKN